MPFDERERERERERGKERMRLKKTKYPHLDSRVYLRIIEESLKVNFVQKKRNLSNV